MKEERKIFLKVDKSARGLPYIGCAQPIRDAGGRVVGAFATSMPVDTYEKTKDMACNLNNQVKTLAETCETISVRLKKLRQSSIFCCKRRKIPSNKPKKRNKCCYC